MQIILFRHGHKTFSIDQDPGLSPKGFEQSARLLELVKKNNLPEPTHVWVSEKKRTYQTLEQVILHYKPVTYKKSDLNYREENDTTTTFNQRVQKFIYDLTSRIKNNEIHYVCTHYDWIETFSVLAESNTDLTSYEYSNWAPGQYLIFEIENGQLSVVGKGAL